MESAGVTLVKGDLRGIARARRLSRATMRNIRENPFFAFIYNVVPSKNSFVLICLRFSGRSGYLAGHGQMTSTGSWPCWSAPCA